MSKKMGKLKQVHTGWAELMNIERFNYKDFYLWLQVQIRNLKKSCYFVGYLTACCPAPAALHTNSKIFTIPSAWFRNSEDSAPDAASL